MAEGSADSPLCSGLLIKEMIVSTDEPELARIREELATISLALSALAIDRIEAADAEARGRQDRATQKALELLISRIEKS